MASEPIMWVRANGGQYRPPQIERIGTDGETIIEKLPATAPPPDDHPLHGQAIRRWDVMLDADGNVVRTVYSGAAADYGVNHPNYGQPMRMRHRKRGWFPFGVCPLVLVQAGQLEARQLSPELRGKDPCEPGTYSAQRPCEHAKHEEQHRKARTAKREAKRSEAFRGEAEKMQKLAQENQAQQNQNIADLVKQQSELIQALIGGKWPMARPNLTQEEFAAQLAARDTENKNTPATDDELAALLAEADADELPPEPPAKKGRKG